MNVILNYIRLRFERLKKADGLTTLIFLTIGLSIATWKYGIHATTLTVFIFISGFVFAEFITNPKFFLFRNKQRSNEEKGRVIFTITLLFTIVVIQIFLWDRFVTILSLGIGVIYGLVIAAMVKFMLK